MAKEVRRCEQRLTDLRTQITAGEETHQSLTEKLQSSLDARGEKQLTTATERTGTLVAQLRRRIEVDDRVAKVERYLHEMESQKRHLLDQQMLPGWILTALGGLFVGGVCS